MNYVLTRAEIELANAVVGTTSPTYVGRRIIARIEEERKLPRGSICNAVVGRPGSARVMIVEARKDAIAEIYDHFLQRGRRLSLDHMASIFGLSHTVVHRVIKARRG